MKKALFGPSLTPYLLLLPAWLAALASAAAASPLSTASPPAATPPG